MSEPIKLTDRPTPETDTFMRSLMGYSDSWETFAQKVEDYSRRLEQQRDAAIQELACLCEQATAAAKMYQEGLAENYAGASAAQESANKQIELLTRQRDGWEAEALLYAQNAEHAKKQRDAAVEALEWISTYQMTTVTSLRDCARSTLTQIKETK